MGKTIITFIKLKISLKNIREVVKYLSWINAILEELTTNSVSELIQSIILNQQIMQQLFLFSFLSQSLAAKMLKVRGLNFKIYTLSMAQPSHWNRFVTILIT